jgi:hypothetical protein
MGTARPNCEAAHYVIDFVEARRAFYPAATVVLKECPLSGAQHLPKARSRLARKGEPQQAKSSSSKSARATEHVAQKIHLLLEKGIHLA